MPDEYQGLGLSAAYRSEHIAWDIGTAAVTEELAAQLSAPAVLSAASRLLVDCNRDLCDADFIPATSHGVAIPGNAGIDRGERARRLERFYEPYHAAIDAVLSGCPQALLLSVHSFTPELNGSVRAFDVGVLFDGFNHLADALADSISATGLAVRMNEPYSALDGLIFSARSHGREHGVPYLEIEINNRILRTDTAARAIAAQLAPAIAALSDKR
jgi:predicted N-formylglutamate amidohydrolase